MMSGRTARIVVSSLALFWHVFFCGKTVTGLPQAEASLEGRITLGNSYRHKGEFHQAIAVMDEALQIAYDTNDGKRQLECLMLLGILHWDIGQMEQSAVIYRRASALARQLGWVDIETKCVGYLQIYDLYVKGKETCASGAYTESIGHFRVAINLAQSMNSPEHEVKCLRQMSLNYFHLEEFDTYMSLSKIGLKMARSIYHRKEEGKFLNNIGLSNLMSCEYSKALVQFQEALTIARFVNKNEQDISTCLTNIGIVYCCLCNYEKALPYLEQAYEIDSRTEDEEVICDDLNNLGTIYSRKGRYLRNKTDLQISLDYYRKSLDFAIKTKNARAEIDALNNIGLVYGALDRHTVATESFQLAIQALDKIEYKYEACNIHCNMGFSLCEMKQYRKSIEHFNVALELAAKVGRDEILWEVYSGLGNCLENQGKKSAALACYRRAIKTLDVIRRRLVLEDFRAEFSRDKIKTYESLIRLLFSLRMQEKTKYDLEIADVVESAKARSFLDELGLWTSYNSRYENSEYEIERNDLLRKISKIISYLVKPDLDEAERTELLARLESEEEEYTNLLNRMRTQNLEHIESAFPDVIPISTVQEHCLDEKTAIIEFFLGERQSIGILIDQRHLAIRAFPPRAEIENSLRAYLQLLSALPDGKFLGVPAAQRIYQELLATFEDDISPGIDHLIIVPDGTLHYLPFETLIKNDEETNRPRYLIELFDISYAPSVSSLFHLMEKKEPDRYVKTLLAVGDPASYLRGAKRPEEGGIHDDALREVFLKDGFEISPLPHSRTEIRRVARCFPKREVDVLLNVQAKEETIKSIPLEEYRIIHFACHGFLDEKVPMRSALVLALDNDIREDGFLQAREISNLSLDADLVVLSACQTGKGRLENAEGVIGLPRTFFYAGARSTLSTLWKISDKSTAEIMPCFYRHLANGKSKAKALRLAKLEMLNSSRSHPFYWGAFVLNGDFRRLSTSGL